MKKILAGFIALLFLYSCSTVAISNRKQIKLIPSSTIFATSFQQYDGFLKEPKLSTNKTQSQMVKTVGAKIQKLIDLSD